MEDSRSASPSSPRLTALTRISRQNEELRNELRRISEQLNDLIASNCRSPASDEGMVHAVRTKSLSNVRAQLSHYEAQLRSLQKRQRLTSPSKVIDLEATFHQLSQAVKDKETEVKTLSRNQLAIGRRLMSRSVDLRPPPEVDQLAAEIARKRDKVEQAEEELRRGEEAHKAVVEKTTKAEKKFNQLLEHGAVDPDYKGRPIFTPDDRHEVEEVKQRLEELTKQLASSDPAYKKKVQTAEALSETVLRELQQARERLKEKEQRKRVLELKLSELGRTLILLTRKNRNLSTTLHKDSSMEATSPTVTLDNSPLLTTYRDDFPLSQTMA